MEEGKRQVVAFLGPVASYTHQAALSKFKDDAKCILQPSTTIKDVFAAVQSGSAGYGVVPFENSSNGSVSFTLDLLADAEAQYQEILVCGETYVPVSHCLLGRASKSQTPPPQQQEQGHQHHSSELPLLRRLIDAAEDRDSASLVSKGEYAHSSGRVTPTQTHPQPGKPRSQPQYDLSHIKSLHSHPQAWGQCKLFLDYYLKGIPQEDASSTSKAAELVARDETGTSAAISSRIAADIHGLDILAEGIQDRESNATRFFVLRRKADLVAEAPQAHDVGGEDEEEVKRRFKSLLLFTISHDEPGALADSLAVFKKHKLNLTSIPTRPSGKVPWQYIFFVEFKGRKRPEGQGGAVNDALAELSRVAQSWKWLGSWESALDT
ncbi:PDT-domain-containing protein [Polychaeton citri CBS 116435]|uniref:prephenate dehydratase n=1 Tax=Polychaeton citri CBS 116435 TaxID=1314669 RepID=A0A9P4Q4N8_9PEZI|nr:PDT-domain-containing protein [Polychaeton citri CBS 116435]